MDESKADLLQKLSDETQKKRLALAREYEQKEQDMERSQKARRQALENEINAQRICMANERKQAAAGLDKEEEEKKMEIEAWYFAMRAREMAAKEQA